MCKLLLDQCKGFCQVKKKSKNPRKTRKWVGGSSPNSDCDFFLNCVLFRVFCIVLMFPNVSQKNEKLDNGLGGWALTNPSFSRIFEFF